jgi:hypothetical protein
MLLSTKTVISSRSTGLSAVAASIMRVYITQAPRVRIGKPELCAAVDGRLATKQLHEADSAVTRRRASRDPRTRNIGRGTESAPCHGPA